MGRIYYLHQCDTGRNFRMEEGQVVTLGRAFDNSILVDDVSVSRHHAAIRWKEGGIFVIDLNSTNGTFVNGEKADEGYFYRLDYADEVKIGNIAFKIIDEKSAQDKNFLVSPVSPPTMVIDAKKAIKKDDFDKSQK